MFPVLRHMNKKGEISKSFVLLLHCKEGRSNEALAKLIANAVYDLGMKMSLKPVKMKKRNFIFNQKIYLPKFNL